MFGDVHGGKYFHFGSKRSSAKTSKMEGALSKDALQHFRMRNKWLQDRIKSLGKTQTELGRLLGLSTSSMTKMMQGDRRIAAKDVPIIARFCEWPDSTVLQLIAQSAEPGTFSPNVHPEAIILGQVEVIGRVEAGYFEETYELPYDERYVINVPPDPRYAGVPIYGLQVRGPSMNMIYPEGSVVVCAPLIHLGDGFAPRSGQRFIVEQRNDIGEVEATVKELVYDEAGNTWLWPRSTHPDFQQPLRLPRGNGAEGDDAEHIRVVALVIGSWRPEP